jgi:hypothetical protein
MNGPAGKDLIVDVPIGTVIREIRSSQISAQRESALGFNIGHRPPKASDLVGEDIEVAKARRSKLFVHCLQKFRIYTVLMKFFFLARRIKTTILMNGCSACPYVLVCANRS